MITLRSYNVMGTFRYSKGHTRQTVRSIVNRGPGNGSELRAEPTYYIAGLEYYLRRLYIMRYSRLLSLAGMCVNNLMRGQLGDGVLTHVFAKTMVICCHMIPSHCGKETVEVATALLSCRWKDVMWDQRSQLYWYKPSNIWQYRGEQEYSNDSTSRADKAT